MTNHSHNCELFLIDPSNISIGNSFILGVAYPH